MKVLVVGGNRFVGLRVAQALSSQEAKSVDLHVLNRTGQVAHAPNAVVYKGDRRDLNAAQIDRDWDVILDFAGFTEGDAREAVSHFQKVGRYVFISTMSVYHPDHNLKETDFEAGNLNLKAPAIGDYQDGKRRAEAVFVQSAHFPVLSVRFPLILGPDDYTRRLTLHIERIQRGEMIASPNFASPLSMIHAEDAARFLLWSMQQSFTGPLNVAAADSISLDQILHKIEEATGRKARRLVGGGEWLSPYGSDRPFTLDVSKSEKMGFKARRIADWIEELIEFECDADSDQKPVH